MFIYINQMIIIQRLFHIYTNFKWRRRYKMYDFFTSQGLYRNNFICIDTFIKTISRKATDAIATHRSSRTILVVVNHFKWIFLHKNHSIRTNTCMSRTTSLNQCWNINTFNISCKNKIIS